MDEPAIVQWEGKFLRVIRQGRWEYADRANCAGAVVIVAVTDDHMLLLVEQYRIPVRRRVIELPAGLVGDLAADAAEDFAVAARRELLEETGYEAGELRRVASGPPSAGLASEIVVFFHARGLRRLTPGGGDAHEEIQVHLVPLAETDQWLKRRVAEGVLVDPKVYAGLYLLGEPGR